MPKDFDDTPYLALIARAALCFLEDTGYALAIAKPAGVLAARRRAKEAELASEAESMLS